MDGFDLCAISVNFLVGVADIEAGLSLFILAIID